MAITVKYKLVWMVRLINISLWLNAITEESWCPGEVLKLNSRWNIVSPNGSALMTAVARGTVCALSACPLFFLIFLNTIFRKAPREFPQIWHKCPHVFKDELIRCWCWAWKLVCWSWCENWFHSSVWNDEERYDTIKNLTKGDTTFSHLVRYCVAGDHVDWFLFGLVLKMCVRHPHLRFAACPHQIFICQACACNTYKKFQSSFLLFFFQFVLINRCLTKQQNNVMSVLFIVLYINPEICLEGHHNLYHNKNK